jgi:hypothetical protein
MFAGSRHDGHYNRGLVFLNNGRKTSDAFWHYKFASARKLGENVLGRYGNIFPNYRVTVRLSEEEPESTFSIALAICYDAFDPTMFLNLLLQTFVARSQVASRIILVPSFNTSEDFVALLRDLSFLSRSTVIYVNALHGDARMFISGFAVGDIVRMLPRFKAYLAGAHKTLRTLKSTVEKSGHYRNGAVGREDPGLNASDIGQKMLAVEHLQGKLSKWRTRGALRHIITVERGPHPKPDKRSPSYVESDTLYYNIDLEFITTLERFRDLFFVGDKFLPEPLQRIELEKAAREVALQLQAQREAALQAARAHSLQ